MFCLPLWERAIFLRRQDWESPKLGSYSAVYRLDQGTIVTGVEGAERTEVSPTQEGQIVHFTCILGSQMPEKAAGQVFIALLPP